jgi:hypothetical protein
MSLSAETKEKRFELEFNNWDISRARNGQVYAGKPTGTSFCS